MVSHAAAEIPTPDCLSPGSKLWNPLPFTWDQSLLNGRCQHLLRHTEPSARCLGPAVYPGARPDKYWSRQGCTALHCRRAGIGWLRCGQSGEKDGEDRDSWTAEWRTWEEPALRADQFTV